MATGIDNTKQLKIQTGVVKRLVKERNSYRKELETNIMKVEKAREAGKEESDIKLAEAVLDETKMIIPGTDQRLLQAYQTLDELVNSSGDNKDSEEYKEAVEVLEVNREEISN